MENLVNRASGCLADSEANGEGSSNRDNTVLSSDLGNYVLYSNGSIYSNRLKRFLKPYIDKYGYAKVTLGGPTGPKRYSIHRLIAMAFILNPNGHSQVNHKDGIKSNNNYTNLEWCSPKQNQQHAVKIGLRRNIPIVNSSRWLDPTFREKVSNKISAGRIGKYSGVNNSNFKYTYYYGDNAYTLVALAEDIGYNKHTLQNYVTKALSLNEYSFVTSKGHSITFAKSVSTNCRGGDKHHLEAQDA